MPQQLDDINIIGLKQLTSPIDLIEKLAPTAQAVDTILKTRTSAKDIIHGKDDRLLIIVGPCSIHNKTVAIEYGNLLKSCIEELQEDLCIIMRVYFEKPRTRVGWKGLINDPNLDGSFDINTGLKLAREILLDLNDQGIPAGTEFLDTIIPQFISDLISWGAIGARTTESQIHRDLASGLSMPIGFKNGTDGNIDIAIDAIHAANFTHHFLGITKGSRAAIINTRGNDACHLILRGGKERTNYDRASIVNAAEALNAHQLYPYLMVDCSHGNSMKCYENQIIVVDELISQISAGANNICGIMLESHLTAGKQLFTVGQKPRYDQSITDGCLSWQQTKPILYKLAAAVRARRIVGNKAGE